MRARDRDGGIRNMPAEVRRGGRSRGRGVGVAGGRACLLLARLFGAGPVGRDGPHEVVEAEGRAVVRDMEDDGLGRALGQEALERTSAATQIAINQLRDWVEKSKEEEGESQIRWDGDRWSRACGEGVYGLAVGV